jgi:predicted RNA-binding Zn-ribbon protein involved in translation (DUF1610 family)
MLWIDAKYVNIIGPRMRNFKRKSQYLWNFSCPLCGDSKSRSHAARGFVYRKGEKLNYRCHKCGAGMSIRNFIGMVDPDLQREMGLEYFSPREEVNEPIIKERPIFDKSTDPFKGLTKIADLPTTHFCREYIISRFIPEHAWDDLYFTPAFYTWSGHVLPGRYRVPKDIRDDEPRLIIPMRNRKGDITAFQGRALKGEEPKYVFVALTKDEPLMWGLDKVDVRKPIYVFEGPIDAMFIPNAIACCGGDIASDLLRLDISKESFVIVYDNEPRKIVEDQKKNKFNPTAKKMEKAINMGFSICVWPDIKEKDVNDMVKKNIKHGLQKACEYVFAKINEGIHSGLEAKMHLEHWNKIKAPEGMKNKSRFPK